MTSIKIDIKLSPAKPDLKKLPVPAPSLPSVARMRDDLLLLDKVKHYIELCDNSTPLKENTKPEWTYLKTVYKALVKKDKMTVLQQEIFNMVNPLIMKFTQDDPELSHIVEGTDIIKHAANAEEPDSD